MTFKNDFIRMAKEILGDALPVIKLPSLEDVELAGVEMRLMYVADSDAQTLFSDEAHLLETGALSVEAGLNQDHAKSIVRAQIKEGLLYVAGRPSPNAEPIILTFKLEAAKGKDVRGQAVDMIAPLFVGVAGA